MPVFVNSMVMYTSHTKVALVGEKLKLDCKAEGTSPISYSWTKDNKPISLEKYKASKNMLIFDSLMVSDSGHFTCTALNAFGNRSYTFNVLVLGKLLDVTVGL